MSGFVSRWAWRLLLSWGANIVALLVASALLSGMDYGGQAGTLILAGLVFSLLNRAAMVPVPWTMRRSTGWPRCWSGSAPTSSRAKS